MVFVVPNEECYVGFSSTMPADPGLVPTEAEVLAAIDLTCFLQQLNATTQGNTVPTPRLCSLFETTVPGTAASQFTADFYRDTDNDLAWETLPRKTVGVFYIIRYGVTYVAGAPVPAQGDIVEVWPVEITSRSNGPMTSGTPLMFNITAAVNIEPNEAATISL